MTFARFPTTARFEHLFRRRISEELRQDFARGARPAECFFIPGWIVAIRFFGLRFAFHTVLSALRGRIHSPPNISEKLYLTPNGSLPDANDPS